jgi:hypothetical protein
MDGSKSRDVGRLLPLLVALVGVLFSAYMVGSLLASSDWNPTLLIKFGEEGSQKEYGQRYFDDLLLAVDQGHDGKYFYIQASDPFYLHPESHATFLDRPTYRAQRMLYPTVAGGFGLFAPSITAWSMIVVNLIVLGFGTFLTARLAQVLGLSAFYGLAFALNPGVFISVFIDSADVFAMAFAVTALFFTLKNQFWVASIAMTFAVLSRETMILVAIAIIAYTWQRKRTFHISFLLPFAVGALWWVFVHLRIGYLDGSIQDTAAVGVPFKGFVEAMSFWLSNPGNAADLVSGVALMLIALLVIWRGIFRRELLDLAALGFGLIAIVLVWEVWAAYFDSLRALAPLVTFYVLMVPPRNRAPSTPRGSRSELVGVGASALDTQQNRHSQIETEIQ